ncbi:outer membrane receptor protein involved in Fe transport [Chitinophaga dinghuensis]|uniref:Outer membrane receptor protein involved in Fe transport n=1 Tax=Chitinophaga dinghuensis TaxID=1539050 RepID=A0A327VMF6_9BACT|nr:TonB-dependent receptor [Chitinophaga dinghuensis]RAJ74956.1 outer membrane receptor protein involved in Fe transport [Chitinophaga dinghuensis]
MKSVVNSIFLLLICCSLFAQNRLSIQGKVTDLSGIVIPDASLKLQVENSQELITQSNAEGKFSFENLSAGVYKLTISHIAYQAVPPQTITLKGSITGMKIALTPATSQLKGVEVTSTRKLLTMQGDKLVYDPGVLPGVDNDNSIEILKKIPGFWIEQNEDIRLNGSGDVTILINGVKQNLLGNQVANLLKSIPANAISKIEVVTGGAARYDAAGGSVINFVLKQRTIDGYSINFANNVLIDKYVSNNHNLYAMLLTGKLQSSTSVSYARNHSYYTENGQINYNQQHANTADILYQRNSLTRSSGPTLYENLSYAVSNKSKLILDISSTWKNSKGDFSDTSNFGAPLSYRQQYKRNDEVKNNLTSVNLIYQFRPDTAGSLLAVNYGYINGYIRQYQDIENSRSPATGYGSILQAGYLPLQGYQHIIKADLEKKLHQLVLETGVKYNAGHIDNNAQYDTIKATGPVYDRQLSNTTSYDEKIIAAYATLRYSHGHLGFMAGGRMEHTATATANGKASTIHQDYTNFLPNVAITYQRPGYAGMLKLSSGLSRPDYQLLNDYRYYINEYKYQEGNPFLKPSTRYTISLENNIAGFLTANIGYIRINDQVQLTGTQLNNSPYTAIRPENAVNVNDYYISLSAAYSILQHKLEGNLNLYGEMFRYYSNGDFPLQGANKDLSKYFTVSWSNNYFITRKLVLETSLFYRSTAYFYQVTQGDRWQADAGITYYPSKKWNFGAKYLDIFNTYEYRYTNFYDNYLNSYLRDLNVNRFRLTVNYRISGGLKKVSKPASDVNGENISRFQNQ